MEETQTERTANFAAADAHVVGMLLSEIVDALKARGALSVEDVAGALLRAEHRAEMADRLAEEEGDISGHHVAAARITIDAWRKRLDLEPALDELRAHHHSWLATNQKSTPPIDAERIAGDYPDCKGQ